MLSSLTIKNFKSIVDLTLELGRFNVFIGENGCGKTNILEALGMAAGASNQRLGIEDLTQQGLRVAFTRPPSGSSPVRAASSPIWPSRREL